MAFKYRVKTKTDSINKENKPKYYAVPVRSGEIDIHQLADDLASRSTVTAADVYATIVGLIPLMEQYLHEGYSIRLDDLGIFTLSVSSKGFDDPKDCLPHRVEARKICFRADKQLKRNLKHVKFERDKKKSL